MRWREEKTKQILPKKQTINVPRVVLITYKYRQCARASCVCTYTSSKRYYKLYTILYNYNY